ncbi:MAG: hypothetical protein JNM56_09350, partial [Planctomycetia bacterium]|nr:hypothetical protein [Planctomycetia bacterium]
VQETVAPGAVRRAFQPDSSASDLPLGGDVTNLTVDLPGLVMPGQTIPAAVAVPVPQVPGDYRVAFWVERAESATPLKHVDQASVMELVVAAADVARSSQSSLDGVQSALAAAQLHQRLPDDYEDVTEGWFAGWKRRLKSKLLNNFRRAFVEPAFRRQSAFNRQLLTAVQELAEHRAALENARQPILHSPREAELVEELTRTRQRCALLEERLARLEARMLERETAPS